MNKGNFVKTKDQGARLLPSKYISEHRETKSLGVWDIIWIAEPQQKKGAHFHAWNLLPTERKPFTDVHRVEKYLRESSTLPFATSLADRLTSIQRSFESGEEYPDQQPIHMGSLSRAIAFLECSPFVVQPSLIVTFEGSIKLHWESKNLTFHAIFEKNGCVTAAMKSFTSDLDRLEKRVITSDDQFLSEMRIAHKYLSDIS